MKGNRLPWVLATAPLVWAAALPTAAQNPPPGGPLAPNPSAPAGDIPAVSPRARHLAEESGVEW